jgi:sugar phosphate permease
MSFNKYRYLIFSILGIAYILVMFHRLAPAVMAVDMMRDLQTGGVLIGILASAYFYPYALMQIAAGLLSDSWGPRRSVALFFIFAGVGSVVLGLAQNVGTAIAARIIVGMGVATVFIPTLKILTSWFEPEKFVRMNGILMSLGGVGAFSAATPLALLSDALGWRGSMIVMGLFTCAIALAVWLLVKDTPQELGFPPLRWTITPESVENKIGLLTGLRLVLTTPQFWPMAISTFLGAMVSLSFSGLWGGPFLVHVYGMSRTETGAVLSAMAIGLIAGAPSLSWLSNKVLRSRKKVLVLSYLLGLLMFAPLAFFTGDFSVKMLYLWCFSYSFVMSGMAVVGYSLVKDLFPASISGTATGILNIFPFAGVAVGQPLIGLYLDSMSPVAGHYSVDAYSSVFKICLVILFAALIVSMMVQEKNLQNSTIARQ